MDLPTTSTSSLRLTPHQQARETAIEKYDGRSDPIVWLKMYSVAVRASRGNEDHMAGYFPLVMGKAPLLWLDNLLAECITSWATLSRLFTTNYQATYNRPGNTHHLAKLRMRRDETLREYTNRYFENHNTLAGVKDEDVIAYYKKGITNIKLFEKIHEANARTIGDLMAYVDKLVDIQDAVMHDFNGEDHDDGGSMSRKRSDEAYVVDPARHSTFLEGDFNMVMDDQCEFHCDARHTMRECKQHKRALGVPSTSKRTRSSNNDDRNGGQRYDNCNCTPDLRDYMIAGPILATMIGIDVIIAAITAAMTGVTTTITMTAMIGETTIGVIVVMIAIATSARTDEMIHATIDVTRTTTITRTTIERNELHHPHQRGQRQWCIPEGQLRDQLHRRRSPNDQKQQTDPIKHQGDRACQHRKLETSALV
jgi:hypothetical protein